MKKGDFSKILVVLIIVLNIIFTTTVLWIFDRTGVEPSSLIAAWFSFTTGELWFLSSIKKKKVKKNDE
jgi:hypothetical protein